MTTRVYLLRHAESANPRVFHGAESDIDLSPRGYEQAETLAVALAKVQPTAIISSAMLRARATATPLVQRCNLTLQVEPLLHERRVGALSGLPFDHFGGLWPETLRRWQAGETGHAPEGAESYDDIRARVMPVWQRVTQQYAGGRLVMVVHGIVVKVLLLSLLPGMSAADWEGIGPVPNVAVSELVEDGAGWRPVRLNEPLG